MAEYVIARSCQATERAYCMAAGEEARSASLETFNKLMGGDFPRPSLELRLVLTELGFPNIALY